MIALDGRGLFLVFVFRGGFAPILGLVFRFFFNLALGIAVWPPTLSGVLKLEYAKPPTEPVEQAELEILGKPYSHKSPTHIKQEFRKLIISHFVSLPIAH